MDQALFSVIEKFELSSEKKYQMSEDFLLREIAGETILVPVGAMSERLNGMGSMNDTAAFLWKAFQTPHTIEEVYESACAAYEAEGQEILIDICRFTRENLALGFMEER